MEQAVEKRPGKGVALLKMISLSLVGIVIFFVELPLGGKSTILPVHLADAVAQHARPAAIAFVLVLILYGALSPVIDGSWRRSWGDMVFSGFKILGLVATVAYLAGVAPAVITTPGMMPFLFDKLVMNLGLIVPIGAVGLSFLICYGLIEFCSVFLEPVMRRIWRTPGYSAVDAVASFVGSYSIGLLITNRMYLTRSYSFRQAVIIATGFSTISVTFMVVVAKVLGLLPIWNYYFWSTLIVTFAVTAITARIPPITWYDDSTETPQDDAVARHGYLKSAVDAALMRVEENPAFLRLLWENVKDGLKMTSVILPTGVSVGLLGLLLSVYTPVFDWLGLIFYPLLSLLQVPEAMVTAKAMAAALAEMFFPTGMLTDAPMMSRYLFGVTSVSGILFFAGSIPCILATEIPIKVPHLVLIWAIRVFLSIPLGVLAAHLAPIAM
ncbi:YjiH family protein [Paracoccus seriniphilus]|uniref:YjiH family protein n=1 Tax=Paracoccus seriniphilus TaxID=184748 RepID=UPI003567FB3D